MSHNVGRFGMRASVEGFGDLEPVGHRGSREARTCSYDCHTEGA